jgi:hypothetical protein
MQSLIKLYREDGTRIIAYDSDSGLLEWINSIL